MYVKSTRPSAKREVQKERNAKRDDQIARLRRAQTCDKTFITGVPNSIFYILKPTI